MASVVSSSSSSGGSVGMAVAHVIGCVRRYSRKLGYGFITVISEGAYKDQDIFVHQSSIVQRPSDTEGENSRQRFRMLYIGECVELDIVKSNKEDHPYQASKVSGFNGNGLMFENSNIMFRIHQHSNGHHGNHKQNIRQTNETNEERDGFRLVKSKGMRRT